MLCNQEFGGNPLRIHVAENRKNRDGNRGGGNQRGGQYDRRDHQSGPPSDHRQQRYNNDNRGYQGNRGGQFNDRGHRGGFNQDRYQQNDRRGGHFNRGYGDRNRGDRADRHPPVDELSHLTLEDLHDPERPKLKLKPRTAGLPVGTVNESARAKAIFGEAKPRDEKVIEERKRKESEKSSE